jgi:Ca-activated chloride channel family protein
MSLTWPWALASLLLVPLAVLGYRRLVLSRAQRRERLAEQGLVIAGPPDRRRRLVPLVLYLVALAALGLALTRPQATVAEPRREGTIILAFDVSNSMLAKDLAGAPGQTRLKAAQAAARAFVERQPAAIRVGVVAFGDNGIIVQQPTTDRNAVTTALGRLTVQGGTSLGRGIQASLSAIAGRTVELQEPSEGADGSGGGSGTQQDIGRFTNAAVVMLSDGEDTSRVDPVAVAGQAALAGVKVFPIGLGSPEGTTVTVNGYQLATRLDEKTLTTIAEDTDGRYYAASDAAALRQVYSDIDLGWVTRARNVEVTGLVAAFAALLLAFGAALNLRSTGRVL